MVDRVSALEGHYTLGRFGSEGDIGVTLTEVRDLCLHQVAAWPETIDAVGEQIAQALGVDSAPGPCSSSTGSEGAILRTEVLKWWVLGVQAPVVSDNEGANLDISHSRTHLRISGPEATTLLNRVLPLDLRPASFGVGAVASSALHHVGVTLWRSEQGYELFIPRGFAVVVWEVLLETAAQFGAEVT